MSNLVAREVRTPDGSPTAASCFGRSGRPGRSGGID